MAVSWSWAFGLESTETLDDEMQWTFSSISTGAGQPSSSFTYTYALSPTRYSLAFDEGGFPAPLFILPTDVFQPSGWITMAVYADATWQQGKHILKVTGGASGRSTWIEMKNSVSNLWKLMVDNVERATFTMLTNDWQYLALKYDMGSATLNVWSGQVWLNGAFVTNTFTAPRDEETAGSYTTQGSVTGTRAMYVAQYVVYDDLADAGEVPLFVTRIAPNADTSEVGVWVPLGGVAGDPNYPVTNNNPFDNTTYTEEAAPTSGDNVVTEVDNLAVQLGVASNDVLGVTNHTYSSGTALQAFASVGVQGTYTDGATVTPDASPDTTYAFATRTTGFTGSSVVECKYEIV